MKRRPAGDTDIGETGRQANPPPPNADGAGIEAQVYKDRNLRNVDQQGILTHPPTLYVYVSVAAILVAHQYGHRRAKGGNVWCGCYAWELARVEDQDILRPCFGHGRIGGGGGSKRGAERESERERHFSSREAASLVLVHRVPRIIGFVWITSGFKLLLLLSCQYTYIQQMHSHPGADRYSSSLTSQYNFALYINLCISFFFLFPSLHTLSHFLFLSITCAQDIFCLPLCTKTSGDFIQPSTSTET